MNVCHFGYPFKESIVCDNMFNSVDLLVVYTKFHEYISNTSKKYPNTL